MKYPDAYSGIKKLFTAEILNIVVAVLGIIAGGTLIAAVKNAADIESGTATVLGAGALGLIAGIVALVSFILQLVGLSQAGKDEKNFKNALLAALAGIVISILSSAFSKNAFLTGLFSMLGTVCNLLITLMVINGIISLAKKLGNEEIERKGNNILKILVLVYVITAVVELLSGIFGKNAVSSITGVFSIVAGIFAVLAAIFYISLLSKAAKMLE